MSKEAELAFADQFARHLARQYGMAPMAGRVAGWLLICEPPAQTAAELAEALQASRTAIGTAVAELERAGLVRRSRRAGERADRIALDPGFGIGLDEPMEFVALGVLARRGLEALGDAPLARKARLLELAAAADFLRDRVATLAAEWRDHRDALRASGELPPVD